MTPRPEGPQHQSDLGGVATLSPQSVELTEPAAIAAVPAASGVPARGMKRSKRMNPLLALVGAAVVLVWAVTSKNLIGLGVGVALGFMIFWHELGHFVTARATGMKATEFFIGFGPRIWSFKRGETEYGIKAIPLGGYVKILGMANTEVLDDAADEPRTYRQQSFPRRVLVASAGSIMHMILAFLCFFSVFGVFGERVQTYDGFEVTEVSAKLNGAPSPAAVAGVKAGDVVVAVNGKELLSLADAFAGSADSDVRLRLSNPKAGTVREVTVRPVVDNTEGIGRPRIGVVTREHVTGDRVLRQGPLKGARTAAWKIVEIAPMTFQALGKFFAPEQLGKYTTAVANAGKPNATKEIDDTRFMSPVGTVGVLTQATKSDFRDGLIFFAAINVFVGVFNMLPMLPLDGGHVLVATYERLRSRKNRRYVADVTKLMPAAYAVMAVMLFLGLSALYLDIRSPISLP